MHACLSLVIFNNNNQGFMVLLGILWAKCEKGLLFVSDCDASGFVDMDIHSLVLHVLSPV